MFTRRKSIDGNQTVLSGFVNKQDKQDKLDKNRTTSNNSRTPKAHNYSTTSSSSAKKRNRPVSSPDFASAHTKRAHMDKSTEENKNNSGTSQGVNNEAQAPVPLNPELTELKRQIFAGFETLLAPIKQEIKELKDDQKILFKCDKSINKSKIEKKFVQNEERHKKLETRISLLEDQLLEKNVIFQGIHEEEYEDRSDIKVQIIKAIANTMEGDDFEAKKTLAGQTSIDSVERVGKFNPLRTRPVKVKFREKKDVDHLFKNRKELPQGVFIDKEYSRSTEKERRLLQPVLNAARRLEKYKGRCRLEGPHLVVEGKHYHRQNLHTLPVDLDTVASTSKSNDTAYGFFGELHPFSNFHPCKFSWDGTEYNSSKQFIQTKKAEYFDDDIARERILAAEDAQDCKEIARDINNFDKREWSSVAERLCEPGISQKFLQNRKLMTSLLETENKTLVESSFDDIWRTGIHIASKDALTRDKWRGVGLLGKILMGIRDKQKETATDTDMVTDHSNLNSTHAPNTT